MMDCTSCGRENPETFKYCLNCGSDLATSPLAGEKPKSAFRVQTGTFEKYAATPGTDAALAADNVETTSAPAETMANKERNTEDVPPPAEPTPQSREAVNMPEAASASPPAAPSAQPSAVVFGVTHDPDTSPYDISGASAEGAAEKEAEADTGANAILSPTMLGASGPSSEQIRCPSCGTQFASATRFCSNCGKRLDDSGNASNANPSGKRTIFMHAANLQAPKEPTCRLISIAEDGSEGVVFTLRTGETACGRTNGVVLLFDNPFVSPTHCEFSFHGGTLAVTDAQSLNGVFVQLKNETVIRDGDYIRIGKQLLRFESLDHKPGAKGGGPKKALPPAPTGNDTRVWGSPPASGAFGRLIQILPNGQQGECRVLSGESVDVGREQGSIVFPTDAFMSGRHCTFYSRAGDVVVKDLGSANGTHLRIRERTTLRNGDLVSVGNQSLRIEI